MNKINLDSIEFCTLFLSALQFLDECPGALAWKSHQSLRSNPGGYGRDTIFSSFGSTNPLLIRDGSMSLVKDQTTSLDFECACIAVVEYVVVGMTDAMESFVYAERDLDL